MAFPVAFPGSNHSHDFESPHGGRPLPVKQMEGCSTSCWQLSEEEIAEVQRTGRIYVTTDTFTKLDPAPEGDCWQPSIRVTTDHAAAATPFKRQKKA